MNTASDRAAQFENAFPSRVDGVFVATSALAQRLDLLRHLIEFSDLLLLVAGPGGAGKSAFIAELLREPGERWRVCEVVPPDGADGDALLGLILSGYGLRCGHHDNREQRMQTLEAHLENQQRHGLVSLIVIDAVERLSAQALTMACDLAGRFEGVRPRLLLAGESATLLPLAAPDSPSAAFTHLLELPPLSPAEAFSYVQARLTAAGIPADVFPEAQLRARLADMQTLPGTVNAAMRDESMRIQPMSAPVRPSRRGVPRRGWRPLLLLVGGAIGLTLLLYPAPEEPTSPAEAPVTAEPLPADAGGDDMDAASPVVDESAGPGESPTVDATGPQAPLEIAQAGGDMAVPAVDPGAPTSAGSPSTAETPTGAGLPVPEEASSVPDEPVAAEPATSPAAPDAAQTAVAIEPPDVTAPASAADDVAEESATAGKTTAPADPAESAPKVAQTPEDPTPAAVTAGSETGPVDATPTAASETAAAGTAPSVPATQSPAPEAAKEPPAEPEPEPEPATAAEAAVSPPVPPPPAGGTLAWLRAQPSGNFTIQLAGSQSRSGAERFVRRHRLAGRAVVVRTRRGDADWFIVVDGSYAKRDAARAAIGRLDAALRRDSPWLRPISEVISLAVP